ncbi:G-type lectin S-receptor-like serine/threonine-protein kinase At4g27290 [Cornus florida]|uniref:G-type lectin S-receptor-like serine/threonine-protein kinase At4g27290 n=1 Tax=Cornus florida TaxID=4283 RepID=UPI00289F7B07|nr:G-type lectin S-receptor-like serine/threonine-protein kinase At4g27290 [Cornus florida]
MGSFASSFFSLSLICFIMFFKFCIASDTLTSNQSISDEETLVSSGQIYELGFFSPGSSKNRFLGIWYKNDPLIAVWVANRNNPITDSTGVLTVTNNGTLVLHTQTKGLIIWSTNTSRASESPILQMLDTGNLVILDKNSRDLIWQSFDYPSDTRLPDMKMGHYCLNDDLDRYLVSWKSADDPSPGDFTYRIENHGLPQFVIFKGLVKTYRSAAWNGVQFTAHSANQNPLFSPVFVFNDDKLCYVYDRYNHSVVTRLTLNQSGVLQRYRVNETSMKWSLMFSVPRDQCDNYGQCGANGVCKISKIPACECLEGFIPKSQEEWGNLDWSSGCVRKTPVVGCRIKEGFLKVEGVKLPDFLQFYFNKNMSLKECKAECLKNCSCTACTNSNITQGGSGCLMWFGALTDVKELNGEASRRDIYIRLAASDLESNGDSSKKKILVIALVVSIASGILMLGLVLWYFKWKKRINRNGEDLDLPLFDLATITNATNNFSDANLLGEGGFGPVYKGNISNGQEIAVKRLSKDSGQGINEFKNEVALIAKLQHRNLVRLVGCCIQREERMLIYEYMPNKSLDHFIFDQNGGALPWQMRFDIVMGIARGLLYLHQDSRLRIIHRDLKASNILLDSEMNPRISDFGLARIVEGNQVYATTQRVIGTYGYMSPEYAIDGTFSMKSDIFSFGVLLLEIVSGKKNRGFSHSKHHHNLLGHAWMLWQEDQALELMDACLRDSCVECQVVRCIQLGLLCVQKLPEDRPPMSSVVFMLGHEEASLPQPKQPGFFTERRSNEADYSVSRETDLYTGDAETITTLQPR